MCQCDRLRGVDEIDDLIRQENSDLGQWMVTNTIMSSRSHSES
jgi:hypothetical protein